MERIRNVEKQNFSLEPSSNFANKYLIKFTFDAELFPDGGTYGSYNVLPARLLNLTYAEYLRFCRDALGAEIVGKYAKFPIALFDNNVTTKEFVKFLNQRMQLARNYRDYPQEYHEGKFGEVIVKELNGT